MNAFRPRAERTERAEPLSCARAAGPTSVKARCNSTEAGEIGLGTPLIAALLRKEPGAAVKLRKDVGLAFGLGLAFSSGWSNWFYGSTHSRDICLGLEFVSPDHVKEMAVPVMAHRMVMHPQSKFSGATAEGVVSDILKTVEAPS